MSVRDLLHARRVVAGLRLYTYVFPQGVSTWTAPSTTTALVSAVGKGSDATDDCDRDDGDDECSRVHVQSIDYEVSHGPCSRQTVQSYLANYKSTFNASTNHKLNCLSIQKRAASIQVAPSSNSVIAESLSTNLRIYGAPYLANSNPWGSSGYCKHGSDDNTCVINTPHKITRHSGAAGIATTGFSHTFPGGAYASTSYDSDYCERFEGQIDLDNTDYIPGHGTPQAGGYNAWVAIHKKAKNIINGNYNDWDWYSQESDHFVLRRSKNWNNGGKAPTTTFLNVTVTPNATYTVINNGALTITYYA